MWEVGGAGEMVMDRDTQLEGVVLEWYMQETLSLRKKKRESSGPYTFLNFKILRAKEPGVHNKET